MSLRNALAICCLLATLCLGDQEPFYRDELYNSAERGRFVYQSYKTSDLQPPAWNHMTPFSGCDDGSYFFMSPRGNIPDATFYIMDHECVAKYVPSAEDVS